MFNIRVKNEWKLEQTVTSEKFMTHMLLHQNVFVYGDGDAGSL